MAKTSGMSINVTDEERRLVTLLQEETGLGRKALFMSLVRKDLRAHFPDGIPEPSKDG